MNNLIQIRKAISTSVEISTFVWSGVHVLLMLFVFIYRVSNMSSISDDVRVVKK